MSNLINRPVVNRDTEENKLVRETWPTPSKEPLLDLDGIAIHKLSGSTDHVWLQRPDGEGMAMCMAKLHDMLDQFYEENF